MFLPNTQFLETREMKRITIILILSSLITPLSYAKNTKDAGVLFLVGGGLKTCTSIAKNNCNNNALKEMSALKTIKTGNRYKIDQKSIHLVKENWQSDSGEATKNNVVKLLKRATFQNEQDAVSLKNLKTRLKKYDKKKIIRQLSDREYYTLLDYLEQKVINNKTGERLKEYVDLANSKNVFSTQIYHEFVTHAKEISNNESPNVIVLTASARDPFEAADFYQTAFNQAGANANWLPLDATLNALMQQTGSRDEVCKNIPKVRAEIQGSVNRELIYPDLTAKQLEACLLPASINNAISQADGIFINGGDQSLTVKAFKNADGSDSKALQIIKEKLKKNQLIIGGTSAGTAVMSGGEFNKNQTVMITNGQSNTAIIRGSKGDILPTEGCQKSETCPKDILNNDLTFNSTGGLGLFHWGIMDTHFSERGRQGRLAKLLLDTKASFAFGVDEATALIVKNSADNSASMEVIGQGGVFIIENKQLTKAQPKDKSKTSIHYMTYGDIATISEQKLSINIAKWKKPAQESIKIPDNITSIFTGDKFKTLTEVLCRSNSQRYNASDSWNNHTIHVNVEKSSNAKSGYGVIKVGETVKDYCSFKSYNYSFAMN